MSKPTQTSQNSASDFFARGRKATTTQRIVTAKKPLVDPLPPTKARLPAPEPIAITKPAKHVADTSFDNDGLDDEEFHEIDFEANSDDDDVQILYVIKPVAPAVTKAKIDRTTSLDPRTLSNSNNIKIKDDIPVRRAHSTGKLLEARATSARKRSNSQVEPGSARDVLESIHQEDLTETEKILRQFDLSSKYGPSTDITRLERWERASLLGLKPPQEIKDTLLKNSSWNTPLFTGRV
ncbi:hypothetical protein CPC16_006936 [Podila verticillata]|nr:hypothetical protein CPC16_006936 [Podila verticillata]KAI9237078.1 MAG: DNA polymerase delta, subunit 4-domain-containing protein [Podila humilis]